MPDALSKVWIIARKDITEVLTSRAPTRMSRTMLLMSSYFFFSYFSLTGQLERQERLRGDGVPGQPRLPDQHR